MTPARQPQREYICNDDDLGCLYDYMMAAMAGNDISELPRLWNQEIGVIKSRPHTSSPAPKVSRNDSGDLTLTYDEYQLDYHDAAIRAEAANAATLECRKMVGDKVIFNKCPFDGDCGKCFLCDNAGGCIISSDEDIRNGYKEAAKAERDRITKELESWNPFKRTFGNVLEFLRHQQEKP